MSLNRRLLPDEKEALKYVLAVDMDLIDTLERMREEVERKVNNPLPLFETHKECYTWMLTLIDKYMSKYYADDSEIKRSSDQDAYLEFIQDNAEMFKELYDGMKPADEYTEEFMTKLKNGEIKGVKGNDIR